MTLYHLLCKLSKTVARCDKKEKKHGLNIKFVKENV